MKISNNISSSRVTRADLPDLLGDPVYFRYRHSAGEKWHYGPTAQNWWECEPLYAIPKLADLVRGETSLSRELELAEQALRLTFMAWLARVTEDDWTHFHRFLECVSDGEGYDVPLVAMERLAELGLVRKVRGSIYEFTQLGLGMQTYQPPSVAAQA